MRNWPGGVPGDVGPASGSYPTASCRTVRTGHAVDAVDAPRQPDPQPRPGPGDDLPEPAHDGPLLRPHLGDAGEQVGGEREQQEVAEAEHEYSRRTAA